MDEAVLDSMCGRIGRIGVYSVRLSCTEVWPYCDVCSAATRGISV